MFKPIRWEEISNLEVSVYLIEAAVEKSKKTPNPALYIKITYDDDNYFTEYAIVDYVKRHYPKCIVWDEEHFGGVNYVDAFIFGEELFGSGPLHYLQPQEVYANLKEMVRLEFGRRLGFIEQEPINTEETK